MHSKNFLVKAKVNEISLIVSKKRNKEFLEVKGNNEEILFSNFIIKKEVITFNGTKYSIKPFHKEKKIKIKYKVKHKHKKMIFEEIKLDRL